MKKNIAFLGVWLAVSSLVFGQTVPLNVQKTAGTNAITGDLVIPSGRSVSATGTGTIGATSVTYATSVTETAGSGSPEGVVTANIGSVYHRTNGSTGTTLYIKESGTGNTGWVAVSSSGGGGDMLLGTVQTVTAAKTFNAGTLKIASGGDLVDANGNELFKFTATASAVNEITLGNAATGASPSMTASGGDTNIDLQLIPKGTGVVAFRADGSGAIYQGLFKNATDAAGNTAGFSLWAGTSWRIFFRTNHTNGWFEIADGSANIQHRWMAKDYMLASTGKLLFSSESNFATGGVTTGDTNLYRDAAAVLKTDGALKVAATTTSTSTTTGALIVSGGIGVAENINAGGNVVTQTIGKTLGVKSGSNAKAGTFTLASGAATLSNTSITANSVLVCWLKTASGAITSHPYATAVSVGTSYTIAGGAGDNSTYNYIILEVN